MVWNAICLDWEQAKIANKCPETSESLLLSYQTVGLKGLRSSQLGCVLASMATGDCTNHVDLLLLF